MMIKCNTYAWVATKKDENKVYFLKVSDSKEFLKQHPSELAESFIARKYKVRIVSFKKYIKK